jgi:geranylgeranyl diphosphate synthase, type II
MDPQLLTNYLGEVRELVINEIRGMVPRGPFRAILYDPMLEYPLRAAKGLRPALCVAACRAFGGRLEEVIRSAAVIELYHNAFLIHDDVEDGSALRRNEPTLHQQYGIPTAINVGDAMLAVAMRSLLENTRLLGVGKAFRIYEVIARMAMETAEGQALELDWIRRNQWDLRDADYWHLVYKKTCWYTFMAPLFVAAIVAGVSAEMLRRLRRFAIYLGVSFQIIDDVLNLEAQQTAYGKEIGGDLVEGKRTLILLHMMRTATAAERSAASRFLDRTAPPCPEESIPFLLDLIRRTGSLAYARTFATGLANKARTTLAELSSFMTPSVHLAFLESMVEYVVSRDR